MSEDCIGEQSPVRRLVTEYVRCDESHPVTGFYRKDSEGVEFSMYLKSKGYNIIPLSRKEQLEYGCNAINLGNGRIVACNQYVPLAI
jgi:N-dimethylarginine dimethylaminohydrolase